MAETTFLDRLADRMGIRPAYSSAVGGMVHTSEATKRALLAAMGIEAPDEDAARVRLDELERAELEQPLPPVVVAREDRLPATVALSLPAGTGEVRWTLVEEHGGERAGGTVRFDALDLGRHGRLGETPIEVRSLRLPGPIAAGYHKLRIEGGGRRAEMTLIVAPARCHLPEPLERGERSWGISAQLYTLRSAANWGIGDFGDLADLILLAGRRGAAVVGLNPLHTLFLDRPADASPYSPASRLLLNPLYIDVTAIPELAACEPARAAIASPEFQERLEQARSARLVDYPAVAGLKLPLLAAIHQTFRAAASSERHRAFEAFRRELGVSLERFCLFQALREHFAARDPDRAAWQAWPEPMRDPTSAEAARFAEEHWLRIEFFAWLQWVADTQLGAAARSAAQCGMPIGIYRDLAVGADGAGAETWANPDTVVAKARVGAPPDIFNPAGQNWGLPPFAPYRLRAEAYRSFVELLRANMRHAGGLRIDHVMALEQLFWIPAGRPASEGAYVGYPIDDLLGILALESRRHSCIVVGEDLGTVPSGFRERMAAHAVLSYRVVFFEWSGDGSFLGPDAYPYAALSTIGSHDLATLRGWWEGHDVELKARCGQYPDPNEAEAQRQRRRSDRGRLVDAVRSAGLALPDGFAADSPWNDAMAGAVHAFLARTRSAIAVVQIDDLTGELEQVNLPGTTDQYPNWRRKLSRTLEELAEDVPAGSLMNLVGATRGGGGGDQG